MKFKEPRYREEADSAMRSYIRRMDHPKGRWEKAMPGKPRRLSHGHFMILANLGSVMKDCLGSDEYEAETERAVRTVLESSGIRSTGCSSKTSIRTVPSTSTPVKDASSTPATDWNRCGS